MTDTKLFFHTNIRLLRERNKISQETLSLKLDLSRNKLQALESGKTVNPTVADLVKFSDYFKVSIDILLKTDLAKVPELRLKEYETRSNGDLSGKELRVIVTTVNVNGKQNIEHVPIKAKAGYLTGYGDPQFISTLPVYSLPNLAKDRKYRSFPSEGDSMYPFPEGAIVIGEYVDDWLSIKDDTNCIVVTKEEGITFKKVKNRLEKDRILQLYPLNPLYQAFEVTAGDIREIWEYKCHISDKMPDTVFSLNRLEDVLAVIKTDIKTLLKR